MQLRRTPLYKGYNHLLTPFAIPCPIPRTELALVHYTDDMLVEARIEEGISKYKNKRLYIINSHPSLEKTQHVVAVSSYRIESVLPYVSAPKVELAKLAYAPLYGLSYKPVIGDTCSLVC